MAPLGTTGRFERSDRLLDSRDFRRVLRRGRRRAHAELVVVTAIGTRGESRKPNESEKSAPSRAQGRRLGITAGRKVGNAVVRNRFKRRIRAWFREHRQEIPEGIDVVVIARAAGARLSYAQLDARLRDLLEISDSVPSDSSRVTTQ